MNKETKQFIFENIDADIHQLALQTGRFPLVDMPFAIRQINGKQKIKAKIPLFFNTEGILYPAQLSLEQSSSESTAKYKSNICEGNILIDLTGGFGVDCCFMANHFKEAVYVERNEELCELATHNFKVLNRPHIRVVNAQTEEYISKISSADWIYVDPARRGMGGKKVVLLSDCEPDVSALASRLLDKAPNLMIKLSPMIDITAAVRELNQTSEVHVLSVENECKEVLLILKRNNDSGLKIITVNLGKNRKTERFDFEASEEQNTEISYSATIGKYLYEPNASVMKAGCYKLISKRFSIDKLHKNSHLYTSNELIADFPGRIFEVKKYRGTSKQELKDLATENPKANITTRNYPVSVEELRKKLKIKDGGEIYLFATTLSNEQKTIIECRKAV